MIAMVIKKDGNPLGVRFLLGLAAWLFVKHGYEVDFVEVGEKTERNAA